MEPFLKWAGGKRWLIKQCPSIFPEKYNTYIEPFLGSGSIFFFLEPKKAILSDINKDLINAYKIIKNTPDELYDILKEYHANHSKEFYYNIRDSEFSDDIHRAARFIYLNRTCWNGLYRVNRKGKFNVPIGTKTNVFFQRMILKVY
jgi:DNA adenine methylase